MVKKQVPRGIRNNNPLNIRIGNTWLGEVNIPTDPSFEQFVSMEYGLRAGFIILRRYIRRYHKNTVASIISTWAPENENQTQRYIDVVCGLTKLAPDVPIRYEDQDTMVSLVAAMIQVECGCTVPEAKIRRGYEIA